MMQLSFRRAQVSDFEYCRALYFAGRDNVTQEQESSFRERWIVPEVRVIACEDTEVGWLQSRLENDSLYLVQLFLEPHSQGKGIGTETLKRLMDEAATANMPMTLGVVKTNPARRLYERLGFQTTHEDDRKFYMRYRDSQKAIDR